MKLKIGNISIADTSAEPFTKWMRASKPRLSLPATSVGVVGTRFARNRANPHGISLTFSVNVGRQFASYGEAEIFALSHLSELSGGLSGELRYEGLLGACYGFENAVLESAEIVGEIGVSLEVEYAFRCGKPKHDGYAISVAEDPSGAVFAVYIGDEVFPTIYIDTLNIEE